MVLEILVIVFLIQCANMISWLIGRRRDVLYHVSKLDPPC